MTETLLALGGYRFALRTAAYQELRRSSGWSWPEIERVGTTPALQFTGKDAETITLPGTIYPHFAGGLGQVDAMRAQADRGVPLLLVTGRGEVLGEWVITRIDETQRVLWPDGSPRAIEFNVSLKRYS